MTKYSLTSSPSLFHKPLPYQYFPILFGLLSGFSVFYFLFFFEAYGIQKGISYSGHSHLFRSISFGALTFVYFGVLETWLRPKVVTDKIIYAVSWYAATVILGSHLIFLLFNFFWNWQEWSLEAYGLIMKEFPLMVALPLSLYLGFRVVTKPRSAEDHYLSFQSENGKDRLRVKLHNFLYANSSENYVAIYYTSNGKTVQHLIRKPLKILEQELKSWSEIERSHRSYLVNTVNIQSLKQLKGKVQVEINGTDIPVSKSFQKRFLA